MGSMCQPRSDRPAASLFVSHGAPTLPLADVPARRFLEQLGTRLARPEAILVASAHWETERPAVTASAINSTVHDFFGFAPELYEMRYAAPGSVVLAKRVAALLGAAGFACDLDTERGLDHGAWVPLFMAWPEADIPVLQVSLQSRLGPAHHLRLGRALAPLGEAGVLVIGSGSLTHNLAALSGDDGNDRAPDWVGAFADWVADALEEGRSEELLDYRRRAPFAARSHPSEEHLLPLFVALGAAGAGARAERLHASVTRGGLRMDAFAFGARDQGSGIRDQESGIRDQGSGIRKEIL